MKILSAFSGAIIASVIVLYYAHKIKGPKNKVHFYVAKDKDDSLYFYLGKPIRVGEKFMVESYSNSRFLGSNFQHYGLNPKDYINLKWEDEPIEVFVTM